MIGLRLRISLLVFILCCRPVQADEPNVLWGQTLDGWLAALRDQSGRDRYRAVVALGYFGPAAKAAVPDLVDAARKGEFRAKGYLSDAAVEALVRIGAGAEVTVPFLIEQFVKQGCEHLTGMGTFVYIPSIRDSLVRIGGPAVPALIDLLNGPNRDMAVCAAEALGEIGPAAKAAVPALIRALDADKPVSNPPVLRCYAVRALGAIGPDAKAAVPVLNDLLDKDWNSEVVINIRVDLVEALDKLGAPPIVKLLGHFLHDADSDAAFELAHLGPKAKSALPMLHRALKDQRVQIRVNAAMALALIDPLARESIPVLIDALEHPQDEIDYSGVPWMLSRLGPGAQAAMPALIDALKKGQESLHPGEIIKSLVPIDPEGRQCMPALIAALKDEDPDVVYEAAESLSLLGPRAKDAVPVLAATMTRKFPRDFSNCNPQVSSARALRRIGPAAKSAFPTLIQALKYRRVVPQSGLGGLNDLDYEAAEAAALLLGSFGAEAKAAVPALIDALRTREKDDASWTVRRAAALALGRIGPDAKVAIPALREALKEKPCSIDEAVVIALNQLDPEGKALAERWVESLTVPARPSWIAEERRSIVLGAMGRTSLEADARTRNLLERLDRMIADNVDREDDTLFLEGWFEAIGRLGVGARLAIPRMEELSKHRNPWVRLWAKETLEQIRPAGRIRK